MSVALTVPFILPGAIRPAGGIDRLRSRKERHQRIIESAGCNIQHGAGY